MVDFADWQEEAEEGARLREAAERGEFAGTNPEGAGDQTAGGGGQTGTDIDDPEDDREDIVAPEPDQPVTGPGTGDDATDDGGGGTGGDSSPGPDVGGGGGDDDFVWIPRGDDDGGGGGGGGGGGSGPGSGPDDTTDTDDTGTDTDSGTDTGREPADTGPDDRDQVDRPPAVPTDSRTDAGGDQQPAWQDELRQLRNRRQAGNLTDEEKVRFRELEARANRREIRSQQDELSRVEDSIESQLDQIDQLQDRLEQVEDPQSTPVTIIIDGEERTVSAEEARGLLAERRRELQGRLSELSNAQFAAGKAELRAQQNVAGLQRLFQQDLDRADVELTEGGGIDVRIPDDETGGTISDTGESGEDGPSRQDIIEGTGFLQGGSPEAIETFQELRQEEAEQGRQFLAGDQGFIPPIDTGTAENLAEIRARQDFYEEVDERLTPGEQILAGTLGVSEAWGDVVVEDSPLTQAGRTLEERGVPYAEDVARGIQEEPVDVVVLGGGAAVTAEGVLRGDVQETGDVVASGTGQIAEQARRDPTGFVAREVVPELAFAGLGAGAARVGSTATTPDVTVDVTSRQPGRIRGVDTGDATFTQTAEDLRAEVTGDVNTEFRGAAETRARAEGGEAEGVGEVAFREVDDSGDPTGPVQRDIFDFRTRGEEVAAVEDIRIEGADGVRTRTRREIEVEGDVGGEPFRGRARTVEGVNPEIGTQVGVESGTAGPDSDARIEADIDEGVDVRGRGTTETEAEGVIVREEFVDQGARLEGRIDPRTGSEAADTEIVRDQDAAEDVDSVIEEDILDESEPDRVEQDTPDAEEGDPMADDPGLVLEDTAEESPTVDEAVSGQSAAGRRGFEEAVRETVEDDFTGRSPDVEAGVSTGIAVSDTAEVTSIIEEDQVEEVDQQQDVGPDFRVGQDVALDQEQVPWQEPRLFIEPAVETAAEPEPRMASRVTPEPRAAPRPRPPAGDDGAAPNGDEGVDDEGEPGATGYFPDLTSVLFEIRGERPETVTGLGLRPLEEDAE